MTSERKIRANRENARKSTGPKTPEGRVRSSRNALKHGLYAVKDLVLYGEDPAAFEDLRAVLWADMQPVGGLEEAHAEMIISLVWRLARSTRIETGLFAGRRLHKRRMAENITPRRPGRLAELLGGAPAGEPLPARKSTELTEAEIDQMPLVYWADLFEQSSDSLRRIEDSEARLRKHLRSAILDFQNLQRIRFDRMNL